MSDDSKKDNGVKEKKPLEGKPSIQEAPGQVAIDELIEEEKPADKEEEKPKKTRAKRISVAKEDLDKKSVNKSSKKGKILDRQVKIGGKRVPKGTVIEETDGRYETLKPYLK